MIKGAVEPENEDPMQMLEGMHFTLGNANFTISLVLRDWKLMDCGVSVPGGELQQQLFLG